MALLLKDIDGVLGSESLSASTVSGFALPNAVKA